MSFDNGTDVWESFMKTSGLMSHEYDASGVNGHATRPYTKAT